MKFPRTTAALLTLLLLYGCVELTGQRFTLFHDVLKDTFHVLIQYDGIHENDDSKPRGAGQIPEFIADGDIMVADWFLHLQRKKLEKLKTSEDPQVAAAARLLDKLQVEVLGRYREPADADGRRRCGAAQLVTIEDFSGFLREGNRLISASLARLDRKAEVAEAKEQSGLWRTLDKILAAAGTDHTWVVADGHALRVQVPVHQDEWAEAKGGAVAWAIEEIARRSGSTTQLEQLARWIASSPFSYAESGDMVTLTIGNPDAPRTIHVQLRDDYNDQLEDVVAQSIAVDMDQLMVQDTREDDPLHKVRSWLPAEVEVGALLGAATDAAPAVRDTALARLHALGEEWNRVEGSPEAPNAEDLSASSYLEEWGVWYARRRRLEADPAWR